MMARTTRNLQDDPDIPYDMDNGSLALSLESFDHERLMHNSASLHSAFRSEESEPESEQSAAPWSPPAWRKSSSGWQQRHRFPPPSASAGASRSRSTSPMYQSVEGEEGEETLLPSNIPLPASPLKHTPRNSAEPGADMYSNEQEFERFGGGVPVKREESLQPDEQPSNNYIRFAVRAEVQHRTEPIEAAFSWVRSKIDAVTNSRYSALSAILLAFFLSIIVRAIFSSPTPLPTPDILKAAQVARTFEPLIYYSESGLQQVGELQDTGVAVWDLGESLRTTNMTSGPVIVRQLDELSDNLKTLSMELTKFFSHVDGDIDGIINVMEWAKRRLMTIQPVPSGSISSAIDNVHGMFSAVGLMETPVGGVVRAVLGETTTQINSKILRHTFNDFLSVLEESINNELQHSILLFGLFENIETQFRNLQRSVAREWDQQERDHDELLGRLWTRVMGGNAAALRKFEKNKSLLGTIRTRTTGNKNVLRAHNSRLLQLKSNLEVLRTKLVSPLVRSNDSSVLGIEDQIQGLDETYVYLKTVREKQKQKTLEMLYSTGSRRTSIVMENNGIESGQ